MTPEEITLEIPVVTGEESEMDTSDVALLKIHAHTGAQAASDSARLYAEDARRDYLLQRGKMDMTQSWGARFLTGPHPQFGSPDAASS